MRHLSRHLQATLENHVEAWLTGLGWLDPVNTPLGALPVTFQRKRPDEHLLQSVQPNLVTVSFGSQTDDAEEELGAGLVSQEHVVFVDIYAENEGIGLALAEDIRDLLVGRPPGVSRYVPLMDQRVNPPTPVLGYQIELDEVVREPSLRQLANISWQVVSCTAWIYLPGVSE